MQNSNIPFVALTILCLGLFANQGFFAQSSGIARWQKETQTLDRLEIKLGSDNAMNLSAWKPRWQFEAVTVADSVLKAYAANNNVGLSRIDKYNLEQIVKTYGYWNKLPNSTADKRGNSPNLVQVVNDKAAFVLNPVLGVQQGYERDRDELPFFRSGGLSTRGMVKNKVAWDVFAVYISEQGPSPWRSYLASYQAVPGATDFKPGSANINYFDIRANLSTRVTKYIQVQLGYDRNFIGNGYRSLFWSDFGPSQLYLKLDTRIWRLKYTNLFTQLQNSPIASVNKSLQNKYASLHHLSINVTPWLNLGLFESIIFSRQKGYDLSYLQPVIFLRSIEQQNGSPDNANMGFDGKIQIAKKVQLYGQLMLDEFIKNEVFAGRNWWGNKQAVQAGVKYADAFGIPQLDLQAEVNQVRPFTYQFRQTTADYTHYNQPLAHPLGGNFREIILQANFQPAPKWNLNARLFWWKQGLDSLGYNFGANPNTNYLSVAQGGTRLREYGYPMFAGMPYTGINGLFTSTYELRSNLFLEVQAMGRSLKPESGVSTNTLFLSAGIRWNMYRREYDY